MARVSTKEFTGRCEECGDTAELRRVQTTALIQNLETHRLSAIGTGLVVCSGGEHEPYFALLRDTIVEDPFEEGETFESLDIELPPPPEQEA